MPLMKKQVLAYKNDIKSKKVELCNFPDAEMTFFYSKYIDQGYKLEIGDEVETPSSILSDEEILEWGRDREDPQEDEEGSEPDIESLRESYDESFESLPNWAYPSGRAYDFFENWEIDQEIWNLLNITMIEGEYPGSDWCGVIVKDYESLILLQLVLEKEGEKVNFVKAENI